MVKLPLAEVELFPDSLSSAWSHLTVDCMWTDRRMWTEYIPVGCTKFKPHSHRFYLHQHQCSLCTLQ